MKDETYIILRKTDPLHFGGLYKKSPDDNEGGMNFRIETETPEKRHLVQLQNDPNIVSFAPQIPIRLIKPLSIEREEIRIVDKAWGVNVTKAVESPFSGNGITLAILDTGIDSNHEAFRGVDIIQKDFTGEGNGDLNGHGTHCAGIAFGQITSGIRFGVAPGIKQALIGKILDSQGISNTEQVVKGITWAIEQGAHIVSMSLGFNFPGLVSIWVEQGMPIDLATSRALETYLANIRLFDSLSDMVRNRSALFQGTLLIAAAGNESKRDINPDYVLRVSPPAASTNIISVGALKSPGEPHKGLSVADFSNIGPDVSAPGVEIYSAKTGGGYVTMSGTSMATPHVAGIAALWAQKLLEESGRLNISQLSARLVGQASKDQLAKGVDQLDVGAGLVVAPLN